MRTLLLLGLCVPAIASAGELSVRVVDPDGLPIARTRAEVVCDGHPVSIETDAAGSFTVDAPVRGHCVVSVVLDGFAPYRRRVSGNAGSILVRLRIAPLSERMDVRPAQPVPTARGDLSGDSLRLFGGTASDAIQMARSLAGATTLTTVVYVDGVQSTALPPLTTIASISFNADPFAAEHADGDAAIIEVITKAPARAFRFYAGSEGITLGGRARAPQARTRITVPALGVTVPVPRLPFTVGAFLSMTRTRTDVPLEAPHALTTSVGSTAIATDRFSTGSLDGAYASNHALRVRLSYRGSRSGSTNVGVGGVVTPSAGASTSLTSGELRASILAAGTRVLYSGLFRSGNSSWVSRANSSEIGITVPGEFVTGGASMRSSARTRRTWTSSHVVRWQRRTSWTAGVNAGGSTDLNNDEPNPAGMLFFPELPHDAFQSTPATWFVTRGSGAVRYTDYTLASFAQNDIVNAPHLRVSAGLRADYQFRRGTIVSPRVSVTRPWRGFVMRAGGGLFVRPVSPSVLVSAIRNDGEHLHTYVVNGVAAGDERALSRVGMIVRSRLAEDFARPCQWMGQLSLERLAGSVTPTVSYTWIRERHLAGSARYPDGSGWLDVLDSSRAARRERASAGLRYQHNEARISLTYELVRSHDNTDGPFAFVERPGDLAAEWARSTGIAPHNVTAAGTFMLPFDIAFSTNTVWRSSSPFNITTGLDPAGRGLYVDRGGRPRNSGNGPAYTSLNAFVYRRFPIPGARLGPRHWSVGLQADNLVGAHNYGSIGSVLNSSTFGKPLLALPGRSFRLSFAIE